MEAYYSEICRLMWEAAGRRVKAVDFIGNSAGSTLTLNLKMRPLLKHRGLLATFQSLCSLEEVLLS